MGVYVSNFLGQSISIINYETLDEEKKIYLGGNVYPHRIAINDICDKLYVPSTLDGNLYIVNIKQSKIIDTISIGGSLSQIVLYKERFVFLANEDSNSIYVFDISQMNPVVVINVYDMLHGIMLDDDKLYVSCREKIIVIDCDKRDILKTVNFDFTPWHMQVSLDKLYVITKCGKLKIIDKKTFDVLNAFDGLKMPVQVGVNNKYKEIYVSDFGTGSVIVLDEKTLEIKNNIYIHGLPLGIDVNEERDLVFVGDIKKNKVKVINTNEQSIIKEIDVDKEPTTLICR